MKINITELIEIIKSATTVSKNKQSIAECMTGKYVIVRTKNEGINCGIVESADETGIILTESRRLWYHEPKDKSVSWYEGVAISGLSENSKLSAIVERKVIMEDYSLTQCSEIAIKSLREHKSHEQS